MKPFKILLLTSIGILITACGGSGGSSSEPMPEPVPEGVSPVISNLNIVTPVSATINEGKGSTYIGGTFDFVDPDGDVVTVRLTTSSGADISTNITPGATSGTLEAFYEVSTVLAGSYNYNIWVEDSQGNDSNVFSGTYTVTEDLDVSFGQEGIVIFDDAASGFDEEALGSVLQSDGKIVVVGRQYNGLNDDVLVQRYTTDGSLDTNFANNGTLVYNSGDHEIAYDVALQNDGKIILVGYIREFGAGEKNILIIRLNTDGTYDTTFGGDGIVTTNVSEYGEYGYAIAIQGDGKIIIAGEVSIGGADVQALIARYNSDGTIDNTFGSAGITTYDGIGWDIAYGVTVQPDGKIVTTGSTSEEAYPGVALTDLLLLRLNTDGTPDDTFGTNGVVTYNSIYESGRAVRIQNDGKIIVAGTRWSYSSIENAALLIRYNSDGSMDTTFAENGVLIYKKEYGFPSIAGHAISLLDNGEIVMAGFVNTDGFVIRVTNDGIYDNTLSIDGISAVVSGGYAQLKSVLVQSDGKIVVAGNSTLHDNYSDKALFLARLTGD
ncbi:hypothetical protein TSL6_13800 [Sulfurovum sp. TSL6]|nr:hypothetical protein TSL6_13800 [Sulfurovum sp. TSL6]